MKTTRILEAASGLTTDEMAVQRDQREEQSKMSFDLALENFLTKLQAMMDAYYLKNYPKSVMGTKVTADPGRRYVRIWLEPTQDGQVTGFGKSAYCFIDTLTGDVLKVATWRGPTKHARGNIFDSNPISGCGPHGTEYLRR